MIRELLQSVETGLKAVKSCTVYQEELPENFTRPSFLVTIMEQEASAGLNHRMKCNVHFDLRYFPSGSGPGSGTEGNVSSVAVGDTGAAMGVTEECWLTGQELNRDFQIPGFHIRNRKMRMEGNILHYLFDVAYWEYRTDAARQMQAMNQKTIIKED